MTFRPFDRNRDVEAARRIWRECGWIDDEAQHAALDVFLETGRAVVADLDGAAECLVMTVPGTMRYLRADLPFCLVSAVTTSRVARKQGMAGRLTAECVARDVAEGAVVAGLGMFEQGFYDRLGFGSGAYGHMVEFDPARLVFPRAVTARPPRRLTPGDAERMHANRVARLRGHGSCSFDDVGVTKGGTMWRKTAFGLGYERPDGTLSHHFWADTGGNEYGPYRIEWMAYEDLDGLLELLVLLRNLGDQVRLVRMDEPAGIQIQDLLAQPIRTRHVTKGGALGQQLWFIAWWQARMCDVPACLAATNLAGAPVRFNLVLTDPIETLLPGDAPWRGIGGEYVIELGPSSGGERGTDPSLPTMRASAGAFTRLWLGVRPASGLAVTDDLEAPRELLAALDEAIRVPPPSTEWDF